MKVMIACSAMTAVLLAFSALPTPTFAQGEKCRQSCTAIINKCVAMGGRGCDADKSSCMSTGSLHMPSGRTFTNLCKK